MEEGGDGDVPGGDEGEFHGEESDQLSVIGDQWKAWLLADDFEPRIRLRCGYYGQVERGLWGDSLQVSHYNIRPRPSPETATMKRIAVNYPENCLPEGFGSP